jgi:hypothetical protein
MLLSRDWGIQFDNGYALPAPLFYFIKTNHPTVGGIT